MVAEGPIKGTVQAQANVQDEPRLSLSQNISPPGAAACPPQGTGDVPFFGNLARILFH